MIELKPCPFCGSEAKVTVSKDFGVYVRCQNPNCGCQTKCQIDNLGILGSWPDETATEKVIERWNRRVTNTD